MPNQSSALHPQPCRREGINGSCMPAAISMSCDDDYGLGYSAQVSASLRRALVCVGIKKAQPGLLVVLNAEREGFPGSLRLLPYGGIDFSSLLELGNLWV
ncbi:MAG: hypothetical protein ACQETE_13420 [Bacteroidota bacterium]